MDFRSFDNGLKQLYEYASMQEFLVWISGQGAFNCGGNLTGPSGYIEAPDFDRDGNYDKDMFCVWQIEVPDGYVIVLDFLMMDITIGDCIYDFVQVIDINLTNALMISKRSLIWVE